MFQGRKKISLKFLKMDNLFAQYVIQSVPEKTVLEGTLEIRLTHFPETGQSWQCDVCYKFYKNKLSLETHRRKDHDIFKTSTGSGHSHSYSK